MPTEYSWEIRERAEELYILDGWTFEQVNKETSVSISQLKRWAKDGDWSGRKKEYRQTLASIRRDKLKLRRLLIQKALNSLDPQDVYASDRLEARAAKTESETKDGGVDIDRPAMFLENLQWLAAKLKETDPAGLKVLARNFDLLIALFKAEHSSEGR